MLPGYKRKTPSIVRSGSARSVNTKLVGSQTIPSKNGQTLAKKGILMIPLPPGGLHKSTEANNNHKSPFVKNVNERHEVQASSVPKTGVGQRIGILRGPRIFQPNIVTSAGTVTVIPNSAGYAEVTPPEAQITTNNGSIRKGSDDPKWVGTSKGFVRGALRPSPAPPVNVKMQRQYSGLKVVPPSVHTTSSHSSEVPKSAPKSVRAAEKRAEAQSVDNRSRMAKWMPPRIAPPLSKSDINVLRQAWMKQSSDKSAKPSVIYPIERRGFDPSRQQFQIVSPIKTSLKENSRQYLSGINMNNTFSQRNGNGTIYGLGPITLTHQQPLNNVNIIRTPVQELNFQSNKANVSRPLVQKKCDSPQVRASKIADHMAFITSLLEEDCKEHKTYEFDIHIQPHFRTHNVMTFNDNLEVNFTEWPSVTMQRENNIKELPFMFEQMPEFGAGSEYNREARIERLRKKFEAKLAKYEPTAQPWLLKVDDKKEASYKHFKGIREGGVSENAGYFMFNITDFGSVEATPLYEWYNFQPVQRYNCLSAEEAEEEFGRRKKILNYFSIMVQKRIKVSEEMGPVTEELQLKTLGIQETNDLKISEMDSWINSDDDSNPEDTLNEILTQMEREIDSDCESTTNKKPDKKKQLPNKAPPSPQHATEDPDDGELEAIEKDYDTESSLDDVEIEFNYDKGGKSVAEEDALRKLLTSEEEDENEECNENPEPEKVNEVVEEKPKPRSRAKSQANAKAKQANTKKARAKPVKEPPKQHVQKSAIDSSSELSSNSPDSDSSDTDFEEVVKKPKKTKQTESNVKKNPTTKKKSCLEPAAKLRRAEQARLIISKIVSPQKAPPRRLPIIPHSFAGIANINKDDTGITEESIRRYLVRKPHTASELLSKFRTNLKAGSSGKNKLLNAMSELLKKINPIQQNIRGKIYYSLDK